MSAARPGLPSRPDPGRPVGLAVPESADAVVAYLSWQHGQIRSLLAALIGSPRRGTVPSGFWTFQRLLAIHEATEQQIVHPRAQHELVDGRDVVDARLAEEEAIATALRGRTGPAGQSSGRGWDLIGLNVLIDAHFAREEDQEFRGLRVQLGVRQHARMRRAVALASLWGVYDPSTLAPAGLRGSPRPPDPSEGFERLLAAAGEYIAGGSGGADRPRSSS